MGGNGHSAPQEEPDQADWMGNLDDQIRENIPLNKLAIPGSHDSGTFDLNVCGGIAADFDPPYRQLLNMLSCLCCCLPSCFIKQWGKSQTLDFTQQLEAGVRYFDLRVEYDPSRDDPFHLVHALRGASVRDCMQQVKAFLDKHEKEVVLLDFNHFYSMVADRSKEAGCSKEADRSKEADCSKEVDRSKGADLSKEVDRGKDADRSKDADCGKEADRSKEADQQGHEDLSALLKAEFSDMLCPYVPGELGGLTLNKLCTDGTRVVIFLNLKETPKEFWPSSDGPIDSCHGWAQSTEYTVCPEAGWNAWKTWQAEKGKPHRSADKFFVCDGVLTPGTKKICCFSACTLCCCGYAGTLKTTCADAINPRLFDWMEDDVKTSNRGVIYIADFVTEEYGKTSFVRSVIKLNEELKVASN